MMNIMRADMYRIWRGKAIYITFAVLLAFVFLNSNAVAGSFGVHLGQGEITDSRGFDIPELVSTGANVAYSLYPVMENLVYFLLAIVIAVAGAAFTHGTIKNDIAWGIPRAKLYMSRLLLSSIICAVLMLFYMVSGILIETIVNGWGGPVQDGFWITMAKTLSLQLLMLLAMNSAGVFLVFVTKRTAIVNVSYLAFYLVPPMLIMMLTNINPNFSRLFDFSILANLSILGHLDQLSTSEIITAIGTGIFFLVMPAIAGIALFRKAEIK